MDAATIINRASARRLTRRSVLAGLLASAAARAMAPLGGATPGAGGSGDWALRSTGSGVLAAVPYATAGDVSTYHFAGTETVPPAFDATLAPFGQPGSVKFTIDPGDGTQSGTQVIPFTSIPGSIGPGDTIWISFRQYMPDTFAFLICPTAGGGVQGSKQIIISDVNSSHPNYEVVLENTQNSGCITGYNANGGGHPPPQDQVFFNWFDFGTGTGDYSVQPNIANDGSNGTSGISPDSIYANVNGGIDPDTGSAFNAAQIEWARTANFYTAQSDGAFAHGLGHPLYGAMRYPRNQWATYLYRIDVGAWGTAATRLRAWCAPEGLPYIKLVDNSGIYLDVDTDPGFNAAWLLPYYTDRNGGGRSILSRTNNITGTAIRVVGLGSAAGAGTLSWNATTKKLTWQEAGGSAGTARGVAAYKRFVNVVTSGGSNGYIDGQYLGIEVTNFAALPATNQTDTITIQSGRDSTFTSYSEFIARSGTTGINATAYNAAGVQVGPSGGYTPP